MESSDPGENTLLQSASLVDKWEKVLWRRQPFPDNHVPSSFLQELNDIPPRPHPRIVSLLFAALPVSQHIAVIAMFLAIFYGLLAGDFQPEHVGWVCVIVGFGGWWIHRWGSTSSPSAQLLPPATPLRPLILPPLLLSLLSPVLGTLTSATTSDSIWPLAGGLFFVHMLLSDFTTGQDTGFKRRQLKRKQETRRRGSVSHAEAFADEKSLSSSLSLTSALSASVVLASRLPSTAHVFSFVLLAVGLFAGYPTIAKSVREAGKRYSLASTISMSLLAMSLFPPGPKTAPRDAAFPRPTVPTLVFLVVQVLVNTAGPMSLWWSWKWKAPRGGGWDVATVKLKRHRHA